MMDIDANGGSPLRSVHTRAPVIVLDINGPHLPSAEGVADEVLELVDLVLLHNARLGTAFEDLVATTSQQLQLDPDAVRGAVSTLAAHGGLAEGPRTRPLPELEPLNLSPWEVDDDHEVTLLKPVVLRVGASGFERLDHDGRVMVSLSPIEVMLACGFAWGGRPRGVAQRHAQTFGALALDEAEVRAAVARMLAGDVLVPKTREGQTGRASKDLGKAAALADQLRRHARVLPVAEARAAAQAEAEAGRRAPDGRPLVKVVPAHTAASAPPMSLGLLVAYARAYQDGMLEDWYSFDEQWLYEERHLVELAQQPAIFLFSNYLWDHPGHLELSAKIKAANPAAITIHGGPDTPKYEGDAERYFAENPHIDITVRGEGEAALTDILCALRGKVGDGPVDLRVLDDVPGIYYRAPDGIVRTGERDRIADLDSIPSPILSGYFDVFLAGPPLMMVLETNRGCPYGCTFCDWGSATRSRIRKFDLDRVMAELDWCGENQVEGIWLADANFGIFERDVEIAQRVADLRRRYGYPQRFVTTYAKNTVKHLAPIIDILSSSGILAHGTVSLQTMDEATLLTVRRKNIKVEKYNELSAEFRRNELPLTTELMMGLPGSTVESFKNDLQEACSRDMPVRAYQTTLLPNSPMNDPEYRQENGIVARPGEVLRETSTYTREDWDRMYQIRTLYQLGDLFGLLRHVAKYVYSETGIREMDFFIRLFDDVTADDERWPIIALTLRSIPAVMVPPASWKLFYNEVREYLVSELGIADDSALATVMAVQHALAPARNRSYPLEFVTAHDYVAWHRDVLAARDAGHRADWRSAVRPLREYSIGEFSVSGDLGVTERTYGVDLEELTFARVDFDLDSPVSRARQEVARPVVTTQA